MGGVARPEPATVAAPRRPRRLAHNTISTTDPAAMLGAGTAGITVENGALPEIAHNVIQNYHVGVLVRKTGGRQLPDPGKPVQVACACASQGHLIPCLGQFRHLKGHKSPP